MTTVVFKFNIGDTVNILDANDISGRIACMLHNAKGNNEYQVVWWSDGKRQVEWLYEWELETNEKGKSGGRVCA